jgi:hypothetical protein
MATVVIVTPVVPVCSTVLSSLDGLPSVNLEQPVPCQVVVPAQSRVLIPVTERFVALEPARHVPNVAYAGVMARRVIHSDLLVSGYLWCVQ